MEYRVIVNKFNTGYWYKPGTMILHREDGPTIEYADGTKKWCRNNQLHREDGPAVEYANGDKMWYRNGQLHREDGPALEYADGTKIWYLNGRLHREDGPAVEGVNGTKVWFLDGYSVSEEEHRRRTQPEKEMTVEQIAKELGYRIKIIEG